MDGIVLLAKQAGLTSFSSLNNVKKALGTSKVGHTGTLDSFAQGLLVVCVGRLTRLAGNITEFNKSYSAVIKFGEETDTLEYTGTVVKTAPLPDLNQLKLIISKYKGVMDQIPPSFSAIHVDGKRASDLVREGKSVEIKSRKIEIFDSELVDYKLDENNKVLACEVHFTVSKGTYIRSLARDIATDLGSAGHLIGLYRTSVGNFKIEDAAGYSLLKTFSIENCFKDIEAYNKSKTEEKEDRKGSYIPTPEDELIKAEIEKKICNITHETAQLCGFEVLHLKKDFDFAFKNGKPILYQWFNEKVVSFPTGTKFAVFEENNQFLGLIEKKDEKHLGYCFVFN